MHSLSHPISAHSTLAPHPLGFFFFQPPFMLPPSQPSCKAGWKEEWEVKSIAPFPRLVKVLFQTILPQGFLLPCPLCWTNIRGTHSHTPVSAFLPRSCLALLLGIFRRIQTTCSDITHWLAFDLLSWGDGYHSAQMSPPQGGLAWLPGLLPWFSVTPSCFIFF